MKKLCYVAAFALVAASSAFASPRSDAVNKCLHSTTGLSGCGIKTNPATGRPAVWCPNTSQLSAAQQCDNLADSVNAGVPAPRRRD